MESNVTKIRSLSICFLVIVNIYGGYFEKVIGISRQILLIFPIIIWIVSIVLGKKIYFGKNHLFLSIILLSLCLVQLLVFQNYTDIFSMFAYCSVFLLCGINFKQNDLEIICKTIVFISIFMIGEAIFYYVMLQSWGWGTYNVRNFTTAPKEDYTILLSVAFVYLFLKFMSKKEQGLKRYAVIGLMILELGVNVIIIQSKTAIIILILALVFIYKKSSSKQKKKIRCIFFVALTAGSILVLSNSKYIPDFVYVFLNRYTGLFGNKTANIANYSKYSGTYEQRNSIYGYCFELIMQHPIFGIGFGNFGKYSILSSNLLISELTQAESGVLDAFVNGGIIYGILYLQIIFYPIIKGICNKKIVDRNSNILFLIIALTIVICAFTNDCESVTFWLIVGCLHSYKKYLKH